MKVPLLRLNSANKPANVHSSSPSGLKDSHDISDDHSIASSLSSGSDRDASSVVRSTFSNGMLIRAVDDNILIEQAEESLKSALDLIEKASNKKGTWIDARDLLDRTAAALDDAGLALRKKGSFSLRSQSSKSTEDSKKGLERKKSGRSNIFSLKRTEPACLDDSGLALPSKSPGAAESFRKRMEGKKSSRSRIFSRKGAEPDNEVPAVEANIRKLADEVVDRRRRILGDILVHDADGIWAKTEYGDGDGISFGAANDMTMLYRVPTEAKDERALIAWASQTGTAKKYAKHFHKALGGNRRCILRNMKNISVQDLAMYERVYVICSTFGTGRPPRDGEIFYSLAQLGAMRCKENIEDLSECKGEKPLAGTSIAIAALGSSAFADFATFGFGLAEELASLGATAALEVTTLDAKFGKSEQKQSFRAWEDKVVAMEKERLAGWSTKLPEKSNFTPRAA